MYSDIKVRRFTAGPFQTNGFILSHQSSAIIIDCPLAVDEIILTLDQEKLIPHFLFITHGHCDHIEGINTWKTRYPNVPVLIHKLEEKFLEDSSLNLSQFLDEAISYGPPDKTFEDKELFEWDGLVLQVLHTPGHSPGSSCLYLQEKALLFAGDLLFRGSVGRSDFPTSNHHDLVQSLKKIIQLPQETAVHSGHGGSTTIEREIKTNPFIIEL